jgi:hypothetical protein
MVPQAGVREFVILPLSARGFFAETGCAPQAAYL